MKTTVVDGEIVMVEGPHESTTRQGTQEAQGITKRPRFLPKKKKRKKTTTPKVKLSMNKRSKASVEEEGFEELAFEKDAAKKKASIEEEASEEEAMENDTPSKLQQLDMAFFGNVAPNEYSIEEEAGDVDVVVDSAKSTTNQMDCGEQVEEEKRKKCCNENCNEEAVVWPFKNAKRASRRIFGYCKSCNEVRLETMRVKRKESRGFISEEGARKKLYGWAQEAPVAFQECTEMPGYTADQVKLGFFNRDFLHSFVSAGRMMVGKEGTVSAAKHAWNAISHTSQPGSKTKPSGLYSLVGDELETPWEAKVGTMMGLRCDRHTNPHLFTLSYFVQMLKDELGITGEKSLQYKVKFGLVATVADYVQIPHQDCECNENNIHSWIFHVPICARGSYIYIWDVENMSKTLVHIPLGSFLVLREDVWHGGIVGGEGNVRVHGGIFEAWAFQSATKLTYPPANQGESLRNYKRAFDSVHNDQPIEYEKAISMVSDNQLEELEQMHQNICKSFPATTLFYAPLPLGEEN